MTFIPKNWINGMILDAAGMSDLETRLAAYSNTADGSAISVRSYGAVGDGITDDTAAIQSAINAGMANGSQVYFPPPPGGSYVITNLTVDYAALTAQAASGSPYGYPGVRLSGSAARFCVLKQQSGAVGSMLLIRGQYGSNAGPGNNNKVVGVVVENLEFLGTSGSTNHALSLRSMTECTFRNLVIRSTGGSGIYLQRDTFVGGTNDEYFYNVRFENIKILVCSRHGVETSGQAAISAHFSNIDIESCGLNGYYVNPASLVIDGGYVGGNGGPGLQAFPNALVASSNFALVVLGTRFEQNCGVSGSYDITIDGCPGYVLSGVTILSTGARGTHCIGLGNGGTGFVNHHGTIVGGFFSGNSTTAGQKFVVVGTDEQNPMFVNPRISYSGFAGGGTTPNQVITDSGDKLSLLDPANLKFASGGYLDWARRISTPSAPTTGYARQFQRVSAVDGTLGQIAVKWPSGNISTVAHEGAPSDWGASIPVSGTHVQGEIVWNTAPSSGGFIGWVCTVAGTPGTWKTFGLIS